MRDASFFLLATENQFRFSFISGRLPFLQIIILEKKSLSPTFRFSACCIPYTTFGSCREQYVRHRATE